ncbi:MAG: ABC transporter permease [Micrococcales bacterium]|nr:ABC transporter permease [Micrococcales bacterium]
MSATTSNPARVKVTFGRIVASEAVKMVSLRSTWWTLGVFVVAHAGLGALIGLVLRVAEMDDGPLEASYLAPAGGFGIMLTQLALVVIAVLTITTEYSSGQIHGSLMAVPTRVPLLVAKAVVLGAAAFVVGAVACGLALGLGTLIAGDSAAFTLSGPETAWGLLAGPLYLLGIAWFSFSVGALLRHSAAAIATLMALLTIVQWVVMGLPFYWVRVLAPWMPGTAGQQMFLTNQDIADARDQTEAGVVVLTQWQGFAVLLGWALLAFVLATVLLKRRDA